MRCEECDGTGKVEAIIRLGSRLFRVRAPGRGQTALVVCPECGGSGIAHCCEGIRVQPKATAPGS
jgi:DnaJ-class molecular chaperone